MSRIAAQVWNAMRRTSQGVRTAAVPPPEDTGGTPVPQGPVPQGPVPQPQSQSQPEYASAAKLDRRVRGVAARLFRGQLTPERISAAFDVAPYRIADQVQIAHEIEEQDDHIRGTLHLRRTAVLRLEATVEAGDEEDPRSVQAADELREVIQGAWFYQASAYLLRATLQQYAAVEVLWEQVNTGVTPVPQGPVPQVPQVPQGPVPQVGATARWRPYAVRPVEARRWNFDEWGRPQLYRTLSTQSSGDVVEPTAGPFMLHFWDAGTIPGDFGLVRAIARLWLIGSLDLTELARLVDRFGLPTLDITHETGKSQAEIQDLVDAIYALAALGIVAHPAGTTVTMQACPPQVHEAHWRLQDFTRRSISRLLLGQDSSQMVTEGQQTGATLQGAVRDDIRDQDALALDASQNETFVRPWCLWNFGPDVACPRIKRVFREARDPEQMGRVIGQAVALGLSVPRRWAYQVLGVQAPRDDEETLGGPAPDARPAANDEPGAAAAESAAFAARGARMRTAPAMNARAGVSGGELDRAIAALAGESWGRNAAALAAIAEEVEAAGGSDEEKLARFRARLPQALATDAAQAAQVIGAGTAAALAVGFVAGTTG